MKKAKGVITIFVSLMLVGVLSLGTLVIEASRYQAAKNQLTDATISASTSMIAAFDQELFDRFGLLAIDTERFTEARCMDYLDFNADLGPGYFGNKVSRLYSISDIEMQGMYNLTYPSILKQQVLSRAKYHVIPQDYALNLYTVDSFFANFQNKCAYVAGALGTVANGAASPGSIEELDPAMLSALKALYETFQDAKKYDEDCSVCLTSSTVALLPHGTVESTVPPEDLETIQRTMNHATELLGGQADVLSSAGVPFSQTDVEFNGTLVSHMTEEICDVASLADPASGARAVAKECREIAQAMDVALGGMLSTDKDGNLLLNSYLTEYFSNRNYLVEGHAGPLKGTDFSGENGNFAAACLEYVFGGDPDETVNQASAYDYILAIRLINNLYEVLQSSSSLQTGNACSVLSHVAWAYYESLCDLELLTTYTTAVPMNKYSQILDVNAPGAVATAFEARDFVGAMKNLGVYDETREEEPFRVLGVDGYSYRDSLALALWLVPNSLKMSRIADLVQLEMRYREQYVENTAPTFLISEQNTYCRVKCSGNLNSLLPVLAAGPGGMNALSFSNVQYAGY